jgi:hypothetical protein
MGLGKLAGDLHQLKAGDAQATRFKAPDDLAYQSALHAVWFDDDKRSLHGEYSGRDYCLSAAKDIAW